MKCPLLALDKNLEQGLRSLIHKCRAVECDYVDSDHDTDYMPAGCILLVVALCEKEAGPGQSGPEPI